MVTHYTHENNLERALCRVDLRSKKRNKNGLHMKVVLRLLQNVNDYCIVSLKGEENTALNKDVSMIYQSFNAVKEEFDKHVDYFLTQDMEIVDRMTSVTSLVNGIDLKYDDFNIVYQKELLQDDEIIFEELPPKDEWQVITFLDNHYEHVAFKDHGQLKATIRGYQTIKLTYSPPITIRQFTVLAYFDLQRNICIFDVLSIGRDTLDTPITTEKYTWSQRRVMLTDMLTHLYGPFKDIYNPKLPIYLNPYNSQPESKAKVRDDLKVNKMIAVRNINNHLDTPITAVGWD